MTRADAARALGADLAQLEAALAGRAPDAHDPRGAQDAPRPRTRTGLREDQAAAALAVLTDGTARLGDQRARRIREDVGAGRGGPGVGRGRARPGHRDHAVPVGPQHPGRRRPGVLQHRPVPGPPARPARRPRPRPAAARRPGPDGRGVHGLHPRPGRRHHPGGRGRRQGDPGRGYPAAAGGGKRRRHVPARRRARLRPAHRTGPVPRRLGTGRQPAAPRRRHQRAGRVRPARPDPRRHARADDGRRRGRLPRADPGRHRHAADGRGPRAAPRAEPPHPRGPHHPRRRLRRARGDDRRRHPGQRR